VYNDKISYSEATALKVAFDSLLPGSIVMADAAYTLTEDILVPLIGYKRLDPAFNAANCYLSQLCIHRKVAFEWLVNKVYLLVELLGHKIDHQPY
jgi:hypothetical protein